MKRVLSRLPISEFQLQRRLAHVPVFVGTLSAAGVARLQQDPDVASVELDKPVGAHLGESVPLTGAGLLHTRYGLTGRGIRVAILDSGVDTSHPDLANAVVAQHCFTEGACPPGNTNEGLLATDGHGHGTGVTGVITADGVVGSVGFAPAAEIVAIKTLNDSLRGQMSSLVSAIDWILDHQSTLKVRVINISIGSDAFYTGNCDSGEPALANAIARAISQGLTVFASTGNDGSATAIKSPACISGVIAVGASYDGNLGRQPTTGTYAQRQGAPWPACFDTPTSATTMACFTNSNSRMDLVAPGALIRVPSPGNTVKNWVGTSFASPSAAGVAALLLECNPMLTPLQIKTYLKASDRSIYDVKNGLTFPFLSAVSAVMQACTCSGQGDAFSCAGVDGGTPGDGAVNADGGTSQPDGGGLPDGTSGPGGGVPPDMVPRGFGTQGCSISHAGVHLPGLLLGALALLGWSRFRRSRARGRTKIRN